MSTAHFAISDSHDDPHDPDTWTFVSTPVPGRHLSLRAALQTAVERASLLARDPSSSVHSVDVVMFLEGRGGMRVADVHVWSDHTPDLPYLPALDAHLAADSGWPQPPTEGAHRDVRRL